MNVSSPLADLIFAPEDAAALGSEEVLRLWRARLQPGLATLLELGGHDRIRIVAARGPWLETADGRRILDVVSAYGALSHGHRHPRVVAAARRFLEGASPDLLKEFPSPYPAALAENLARLAPGDLGVTILGNSGAEAVEAALKCAFRHHRGRRDLVVSAHGSLHGKTLGALQVTGHERYRAFVPDLGWPRVPFGEIEALREVFEGPDGRRVAAVVLEPIQGEGGVVVPPPGYLAAVRDLCDRHGALLVLDEVQTGLGRTGELFRCQAEGVVPDALCLAKSLGGGVATIGAAIVRPPVFRSAYRGIREALVHTSTFGGRAFASAVALEALRTALEEDFAGRAREVGAWLRAALEDVAARHPGRVREVRGEGLMLGVELEPVEVGRGIGPIGGRALQRLVDEMLPGILAAELLHRHDVLAGFLLNHPRVLRVYPPLVATVEDVERVPRALEAVLSRGVGELVRERVLDAIRRVGVRPLLRWISEWGRSR